jgi:hypothetical protein
VKYAFRIRQDVVVPEPEDDVPLGLEVLRAYPIVTQSQRVLATVELDNQLGFRATEVCDEGADGMLAAESRADESAIPKSRPQLPLRIRLIASKSARVTTQMLVNLPPHPALSPDGGEGICEPRPFRTPLPFGERVG